MRDEPTWMIALVEDEASMRRQIKEFLEGEQFPFGKVVVGEDGSFEGALNRLRQRKVDLLILDIFKGNLSRRDTAGLAILEEWKATGFAPIIIHTALPEGLAEQTSAFVRLVPKESGNLEGLGGAVQDIFSTKVPQIYRAIADHLDASLRDYMWGFVVAQWPTIEALTAKADFLHLLIRRLGYQFAHEGLGSVIASVYPGDRASDPEATKVHPAEFYIKPALGRDPRLGDLRVLKRDGKDEIYVVLWPSCDLVEREQGCRVEKALCARTTRLEEATEFGLWISKPGAKREQVLMDLMRNNRREGQRERYHFLPPAWDIPALIADFQDLEHVPVSELRAAECLACLASPFAESVGARFLRYLSRLGTPDLDVNLVLAGVDRGNNVK